MFQAAAVCCQTVILGLFMKEAESQNQLEEELREICMILAIGDEGRRTYIRSGAAIHV